MASPANIFHLGIKELRTLWHDKVLVVLVIWAFTGAIYSVATGSSLKLHNAPIAIVDEDHSQLSMRLRGVFREPYFMEPEIISMSEIDRGMDSGEYTFVLDIPPNFEKDVLSERHPEIQVFIDATRMSQAYIGTGYIQNLVTDEIREFTLGYRSDVGLPIALAVRVKFNPNLTSSWFGSVMEIINVITLLSIILAGAALLREREHGTIEHLLVMPLTPFEIMTAKIWANGLVVLVAAALSLWLVVHNLLRVPIVGSVTLFLLGCALHLFSITSLGILFGTIARSMPQLGLLMILILLPMQMLSGGITPRESMPGIVQDIMLLAPTTHFVRFAQAILYRGAGFDVVWPSFLAIVAIGSAFFLSALVRFRTSLALTQT